MKFLPKLLNSYNNFIVSNPYTSAICEVYTFFSNSDAAQLLSLTNMLGRNSESLKKIYKNVPLKDDLDSEFIN